MPPSVVQVTAGHLDIEGVSGGARFQFLSSTWTLTNNGGDQGNVPLQSGPHAPGTHSIGADFFGGFALGYGYAALGTTQYQRMWYAGTLSLKGTVKLLSTMPDSVVIVRPFKLTGRMQGYPINPFVDTSTAIFDDPVKGSGKAIIALTSIVDQGIRLFDLTRVTYNFL